MSASIFQINVRKSCKRWKVGWGLGTRLVKTINMFLQSMTQVDVQQYFIMVSDTSIAVKLNPQTSTSHHHIKVACVLNVQGKKVDCLRHIYTSVSEVDFCAPHSYICWGGCPWVGVITVLTLYCLIVIISMEMKCQKFWGYLLTQLQYVWSIYFTWEDAL